MTGAPSRARAAAGLLLALCGLVVVGRLSLDAWLVRPAPDVQAEAGKGTNDTPAPLLIAIVDGLRAEAVSEEHSEGTPPAMPFWRSLAREGVDGIAITGEPTLTACCVRTILTGRNPDLVTAFQNFDAQGVRGSVTELMARRGIRTAHAGDAAAWQLTSPWYAPADILAFRDQGPKDQGETDDRSFPFALSKAMDPAIGFLTFHLVRPDHAGHKHGATGPEYHAACATVDVMLRQVVTAFREAHPNATVLLAADHGVTARGTHGGGEPGARRAPFALAGPRVAPGSRLEAPQAALAPTLCALLGLPMPPLAESPPALDATMLSLDEKANVLDAYVKARLEVAKALGARDIAEAIEARRGQVFAQGPAHALEQLAAQYRDMERRVFTSVGTWSAALALALAALWIACLCRTPAVAESGAQWEIPAMVLALGCAFMTPVPIASIALVLACAAYAWRTPPAVRGSFTLTLAGVAMLPLLGAAGLLLQNAFDATEDARPAALRTACAAGALALVGAWAISRPPLRRRAVDLASRHPALLAALGGVCLGFTLSLRLFIDPFLHMPLLFAAAALAAALALAFSSGVKAVAPGARWVVVGTALVVFVGGRVAEGWLADWAMSPFAVGPVWKLAALACVVAITLSIREGGRWRSARGENAILLPALVAVIAAALYRVAFPGAALLWKTGVFTALASLVASVTVASRDDARLVSRLLACAALASLLHERSDAQVVAFVVFEIGALAASRFPGARTRAGIAGLAIVLLALRIGVFHAMGFTESFSTIDTGAGIVPGAARSDPVANTSGISAGVVEAVLLLATKFALVWIVLLASVARSLARDGGDAPGRLRLLATDLGITFAARGAAIVAGMWVWWRSSWWVSTAYPVYVLGAGDVLLLAFALLMTGGFSARTVPAMPQVEIS